MRNVITLTEAAEKHIEKLLASSQETVLMVSINNKGCSGHSYEYKFVTESSLATFDEQIQLATGIFCIRADSVMRVLGSTLDVETNSFEQKFIWHNPQAANTCGCGKSVSF